MDERAEEPEIPSIRTLLVRLALALSTLLIGFAVVAWLLREPLEQASAWFVGVAGLPGLALLVLLVDTLPLTHEPILFLGWSGGLGFWPVWAAASIGSIGAGATGWCGGRLVARWSFMMKLLRRYRVVAFLERFGVWAVAIAAVTPIPFALVTWAAGASGVSFARVLFGSLFRAPRVLLYLTIIVYGWHLPGLF